MNRLAIALATWGGCGYFPKSPGTAGSLGGIVAAWVLIGLGGRPPVALLAAAGLLLLPGVWAAGRACLHWQSEDPQRVVVDEVFGQWITLAAAPGLDWRSWTAAFVLFRLFDIWKPFPARAAEKLPGGWGVMADDLVAGVYGAVVLMLARRLNYL